MAATYKRLGAAAGNGTLATGTNLYTASGTAGTSTIVSSLVICNTSGVQRAYSIAINTASGTFAAGEYLVYQAVIAGNDTVTMTLGLTLDPAARYLNISASDASVNISAFGVENS